VHRSYFVAAALLTLSVLSTRSAQAEVHTVTISFTSSGDIGGTPFSNASSTIIALADTTNRQSDGSTYFINTNSASINIDGIGSADFTLPTRIWANPFDVGAAGFGRAGSAGLDILDMESTGFNGWDMLGPVGPVFDATLNPIGQAQNLGTTLGTLNFTAYSNGTFAATPEPASISTVLALAGVAMRRRRRSA
jgi:hypothetical protein